MVCFRRAPPPPLDDELSYCSITNNSSIGPSAGITMASSLLSLALNHPLDPAIAMTGELTVTGKVLRIGGLREKTVAARRAGATEVIFPADNLSDWLELPEVRLFASSFSALFSPPMISANTTL